MKIKNLAKVLPLVGIMIFLWIIYKLDLNEVLSVARTIRWDVVLLSLAIGFAAVYVKSLKWKKIIDYSSLNYSTWNSFVAWMVGFTVGMITPGRIGDFYRVVYLKNENKRPWGLCFATVFLDRLLDIIIMLLIAGAGVLYLVSGHDVPFGRQLGIIIGVLLVLGIVFMLVFREGLVRMIIRPLFYRLVPEKYQKSMKINYSEFFSIFNLMAKNPARLVYLFVIGLMGWFMAILQAYVLALALNLDVSYVFILSIVPLLNIVELLPISFSGIGTRDAAMIFFMSLVSIKKEAAVAFSLMILITIYILALPGLVYWLKHPTKLPKA